ncbi:MAG: PHP domain-containing protein [Christensenellales bacterium]
MYFESQSKLGYDPIKEDLVTKKEYIPNQQRRDFDSSQQFHNNVDTHIHSKYTLGCHTEIEDIVKRAKQNSVDFISITDHNNAMAFHTLMKSEKRQDNEIIYDYDGVKILCGSEVTCYMDIHPAFKVKLHLLCYGYDRGENSTIMDLISAKYNDYKRSQYAVLYYLINKDEIYETTQSELKAYMRDCVDIHSFTGKLSYDFAIDFYKWKGLNENRIKKDLKGYKDDYLNKDTLRFDIVDLINATHKDGGLCALAHPTVSIEKFRVKNNIKMDTFSLCKAITERLLSVGMDGIELSNKGMPYDYQYNNYFRNAYLVSCGSDMHDLSKDFYQRDIGKYRNNVKYANIEEVMTELDKYKKAHKLTLHQQYSKQIKNQNTQIPLPYTYERKPKYQLNYDTHLQR